LGKDLDYIKSLVVLVKENGLTELKIKNKDEKIVIKREKEFHMAQSVMTSGPLQVASPAPAGMTGAETEDQPADSAETKAAAAPTKKGTPVVSPMVGTFYRCPSPGSPSFVEVGQKVEVGQVLCIIESMKLMNEIESEVAGTVIEVCVENSDAVETGTVLMYID
jgi:acetyl-CoA carboxylase biotin carboxyl carrier protein